MRSERGMSGTRKCQEKGARDFQFQSGPQRSDTTPRGRLRTPRSTQVQSTRSLELLNFAISLWSVSIRQRRKGWNCLHCGAFETR